MALGDTGSSPAMNDTDRREYCQRYRERLARFHHDPRTLGWDKGKQPERFQALTELLPIAHVGSLLDVGCGFGDLYPFLRERGFRGAYTGIDLVSELIEVGRTAYPEAELIVGDFTDYQRPDAFDVVLSSGIFNARLTAEDHWDYVRTTLGHMFDTCRVAACADFLSAYSDAPRAGLFYAQPEAVFRFAKSLSRRVALLHDYMPFEFAVYVFKPDEVADRALFRRLQPKGP
jgi:SAM-dependent methyltransferase